MTLIDITPAKEGNAQTALLRAVLEDATRAWREELGDVPDETVLWQPFPGGHSIGALILHIADVEAHWLHEVGAGQTRTEEELKALLSKETDQDKVVWPTPPAQPLAWYYAQHDAVRERTRALLAHWDNPEEARRHRGDDFTRRWLLSHVIAHEAYHGGQAVLLHLLHARTG